MEENTCSELVSVILEAVILPVEIITVCIEEANIEDTRNELPTKVDTCNVENVAVLVIKLEVCIVDAFVR